MWPWHFPGAGFCARVGERSCPGVKEVIVCFVHAQGHVPHSAAQRAIVSETVDVPNWVVSLTLPREIFG
jgi:hypothetical protein